MKRSTNRCQITFLLDEDDNQRLRSTLPGMNLSAKLGVAIKNFLHDVQAGIITADTVLKEETRVKNRAFKRD